MLYRSLSVCEDFLRERARLIYLGLVQGHDMGMEIVRAFGVDTLVDDKAPTDFLWN